MASPKPVTIRAQLGGVMEPDPSKTMHNCIVGPPFAYDKGEIVPEVDVESTKRIKIVMTSFL